MKIKWNRVTWYSKLIALIIFIIFPFAGFYWGIQAGELIQLAQSNQTNLQPSSTLAEFYTNPSEWQADRNDNGGFSIAYPIDFPAQDSFSPAPTADWSLRSNGEPGVQYFTLTVPKAFEPQSNFDEATLVVGSSRTPASLKNCLVPGMVVTPGDSTSTLTINGVQFAVYHFTGAGAGNYYETTSYRTTHAGQCYSIEYTIHSGQIANYPAFYNLHQFNDAEVNGVLGRIVQTFNFL